MFNMNKLKLSFVAIAAFSSVFGFARGATETLTTTRTILVQVAEEISAGTVKSAADLVNRQVGAIALSQAEANMVYSAALPIAEILRTASPAVKSAFTKNADALGKAVAGSKVRPSVAANLIRSSLEKGIVSVQQIQTDLNDAGADIGNRVLTLADANMNATAVLEQYKALTPAFQRLLAAGMDEQLRKDAVSMLMTGMTSGAELAAQRGEDVDRYVSLIRRVVEHAVALYRETLSWSFLEDILKGFPKEGTNVALLDYLLGADVSLENIEQEFAAKLSNVASAKAASTTSFSLDLDTTAVTTAQVSEGVARLSSCFLTGTTDAAGQCQGGVCTADVPAGLR
jgi:hypothetical protein